MTLHSAIVADARLAMAHVPACAYLISDPPYNQDYHYSTYDDALTPAAYADLIRGVFAGRQSVVMHYPEEIINVVGPCLGPVFDVMAWVYPSNQGKQHRLVGWWGCKPDWRKVPQPYKNPKDRRVAALIAAGHQARGYDWVENNHVKNVQNAGHPCPLPMAIAERLVLATTEPGDLVVDPFCGIGTILAAAKKHGRQCLGFDIDPTYVEMANAWLGQVP